MKKYSIPVCVVILIISMCFCAFSQTPTTQVSLREGIWPYEFTERDKSLLRDFGLNVGSNAMMYQFNAPKEATELLVRVYQVENNRWQLRDKFGISIGEEREPVDRLSGIMTIQRKEPSKIEFQINCAGNMYFPVMLEEVQEMELMSWGQHFMDSYWIVQTGREIPVMLLAFNEGHNLQMYNIDIFSDEIHKEIESENTLDILVTATFNETDQYKNIEIEV